MEQPLVIEVESVSVSRNGRHHAHRVLQNVSFSLASNEVGAVVGPNGVGKSTMFEVLTGALVPDSGTVRVNGGPRSGAKIGIVWQRTSESLMPWMSTSENIALPLKHSGVPRAERHRKVRELCQRTNLMVPLDRPPQFSSGGEQQKTCILRALASGASVLLMDEPWSNLSYETSLELLEHLQDIRARSGLTMLLVSHSAELTVFMSDVVIPFRAKPVSVSQSDLLRIECPYSPPRPLHWMHEETFRRQVDRLRATMQ